MSIHLIQAKVVLKPIWRLYSLCIYIRMETVFGASTGLSAFISVFPTTVYTNFKKCKN